MSAPTVIAEPRTTNTAIFAMLPIVIDLLERRAIMRLSGNLASFTLIFRISYAYVDDNSRGCWPYSVEKRFRPSSAVRLDILSRNPTIERRSTSTSMIRDIEASI